MAKWDTAEKPKSGGAGGDIKRFSLSKDLKPGEGFRIRIIGDYKPYYHYWVKTNEGKFRTLPCLSFDPKTEAFPDELADKDLIRGKKGPFGELKPDFAYVVQGLDSDGELILVELKKGAFGDIVGLAQHPDYGNPSDPDNGYYVEITKEKTGPLTQNIEYKAIGGRSNRPLTEDEKKLELYDLDKLYKRQSFDEQKQWLQENTDLLDEDSPANNIDEDDGLPDGMSFND